MMHNIGPFHVNGNVLTKHGRTVGEPAMLIMRTEDFCVPVKIGSKEYISVSYQRFIRTRKDQAHQVQFTKEYRKETEYREFVSKMIHCFKLNDNGEDIEDKVARLQKKGF